MDSLIANPITVHAVGDKYFVWNPEDIVWLRRSGKIALTPVGACPMKTATRGKAAAVPALLTDEEMFTCVSKGWVKLYDTNNREIDAKIHMEHVVCNDKSGIMQRKRIAYKKLTELGYAMTNGIKFGCDYLAYRADPTGVHADFMVSVLPEGAGIPAMWLTSLSRVATTALKTAVIAWVDVQQGSVRFAAFRRMGPGTTVFSDTHAIVENISEYMQTQSTMPNQNVAADSVWESVLAAIDSSNA